MDLSIGYVSANVVLSVKETVNPSHDVKVDLGSIKRAEVGGALCSYCQEHVIYQRAVTSTPARLSTRNNPNGNKVKPPSVAGDRGVEGPDMYVCYTGPLAALFGHAPLCWRHTGQKLTADGHSNIPIFDASLQINIHPRHNKGEGQAYIKSGETAGK